LSCMYRNLTVTSLGKIEVYMLLPLAMLCHSWAQCMDLPCVASRDVKRFHQANS
jgi:hypothetical protein